MQRDATLDCTREFSNSLLRRSVFLSSGNDRLKVDPDGSTVFLHSARFGKVLFGRGMVEPFKIQAGVIVPQRQREMRMRLSPGSVGLGSLSSEPLQASHSIRLCGDQATGYVRSVGYTNRSELVLRMRVLTLNDPTSMNFRLERDHPAEIGVNAFNRGDHVVMDDVGDTTGVRVVGFSPRPTALYLTRNRQKALELLSAGELPESTAGMSGAILVLSQHDVELRPGSSFEVQITSLYHGSSLEAVLSELETRAYTVSDPPGPGQGSVFRCSSPSVNFSYVWARAALDSLEREAYPLDRISAGFGLGVLRPDLYEKEFEASKRSQRRDGLLPHSASARDGPMETSLFIIHACGYLGLRGDRKLAKRWYPALKKAGKAIQSLASGGLISTKPGSPDGWRRRLGSGYPTGFVTEVNLVAARALRDLSLLARFVNRPSESSGFLDASDEIRGSVDEKLRDIETGSLALNLDGSGRLHMEPTIDQAVALSYFAPDASLASSTVHRLLENDFETGYGPRCVSRTNALYYSPSYGEGQLGGFWTRGSLAHAVLSYASGHPAIGGAQLEKVATLVHSESEKMGGVPGEFPYWFDPERRQIDPAGSDPVAASRFVEALLLGEAGLSVTPGAVKFRVPERSRFTWALLHGFQFGGGSIFVGRSPARSFIVSSFERAAPADSLRLKQSEMLDVAPPLECVLFWDQTSLIICAGNASGSTCTRSLQIPVRGKPFATALFVDVDEFSAERWDWERRDRRKLLDRVDLQAEFGPHSWRVFRVSPISAQAR
jgi:hypothetical protein